MATRNLAAGAAALATCMVITACGGSGGTSLSAAGSSVSVAASSSASAPAPAPASAVAVPGATCDAEAAFVRALPLRRRLAQLLMVGVTGPSDARTAVRTYGVGGIFIGSWTDQSILSRSALKAISDLGRVPLMVSIDEEGGRVSRVPGADLPSARQMEQTMTVGQVRAEGERVGGLMSGMGITVDFAPDADVSDEPADAVIGDRSFSNDPATVTRYAQAFAAGLRDAGVYPVYKHFPGHGHGSGDSHVGAVTTPPIASMDTDDLVPFRAVAGEDAGVMVGHLDVPGLTDGLPASLSPAAMALLRTGTGYGAPPHTGPIFTDDLSGMGAISDQYPIAQAVTKAIEAGADVALWITTDHLSEVLDSLVAAVNSRRLSVAAVDRSVLRVARAKHAVTC